MIHESTDYRHRNTSGPHGTHSMPGDPHSPLDVPGDGGSAKGPLIGLAVIIGFIALMAALSYGADPEESTSGSQGTATQSVPSDGSAGGVSIAPAPAPAPQTGE